MKGAPREAFLQRIMRAPIVPKIKDPKDLGLTAGSDQWPDLDSMIIEEWGTTTVRETITNADSIDSMNIGDKQIGVGLSRLHKD